MNRTAASRVLVVAALVGLALSLSACGGSKKSTSTTTAASADAEWAGGVCSAFTDWRTSLTDIKSTLLQLKEEPGAHISSSSLRQAGRQAEAATNQLARTLKNLGLPETPEADKAKTNITAVQSAISDSMDVIKGSLSGQPSTSEIQTVIKQLRYIGGVLTRSVAALSQADPSGALSKAFHDAPSCAEYV
jgi:hypothetical protein